jgi:hypothetical protein
MTMNVIDLLPLIERTTACAPARAWLEAQSPLTPAHQLWATCPKPGWLIWAASHTPALDTEGSLLASRVVSDLAKQVPTYIPDLPNDAARHIRLIEITLADTRLSEAERYAALITPRYELEQYANKLLKTTRDARQFVLLDAIYRANPVGTSTWNTRFIAPMILPAVRSVLPAHVVLPDFEKYLRALPEPTHTETSDGIESQAGNEDESI